LCPIMAVASARNRYTKPGSLIFDFAAIRLIRHRRHIQLAHVEPTYFRPIGLSSLNPRRGICRLLHGFDQRHDIFQRCPGLDIVTGAADVPLAPGT